MNIISHIAFIPPILWSISLSSNVLATLQIMSALSSLLYHCTNEHPIPRLMDFSAAGIINITMAVCWFHSFTKSPIIFITTPLLTIISFTFWFIGGYPPRYGGNRKIYQTYHPMWHICAATSLCIQTYFIKTHFNNNLLEIFK
jgi:hypothetical protein